ncbi:beta carbonic anhydrase 5, chloroplastic-like isoform X2 [Malus sylvestris]|uniref:beta carbonic anhydrase 5, chloroplastic-like isoform X2 n=1 Tax=Malus domestica TaxID=3750 RepID=UPI0010AAC9BA|nr:beta carbonic anhydrase 5, chloroplastic-like isoform X2 [Malus domestica]XP_050107531.1 beta carbonic anhydrase 5, chloroplastic-like isoform X2 [Malus sylvestris]
MAVLAPTSVSKYSISNSSSSSDFHRIPFNTRPIFGSKLKSGKVQPTQLRLLTTSERCLQYKITTTCNLQIDLRDNNCPGLTVKASRESLGITEQHKNIKLERVAETDDRSELFEDMKQRFLDFKNHKYMENLEHYQNLAKGQAPKFMVISCADSRVCPSTILGFQPGEAFIVRNIANLVPSLESGPSETNAALEFSVNSLKVENILVVGHSCCGGIRALMSMDDEIEKSFIQNWVVVGKDARSWTKAAASTLSFDQQCKHCEKESINRSLLNLLTYPWIEEKVKQGVLAVHGGYYDFVECTFEKWTLDYKEGNLKEKHGRISVKNHLFWS